MGRKQGFKKKTLLGAIEKIKAGDVLTEKESELCVKLLSRKITTKAIIDTSQMDEFYGSWKHICPTCGSEVFPDSELTECQCGQLLNCPPFSEWAPGFRKNHVWDSGAEKWVEGVPETHSLTEELDPTEDWFNSGPTPSGQEACKLDRMLAEAGIRQGKRLPLKPGRRARR